MKADDDTLSRLAKLSQLGDKVAYRQFLDICIAWLRPFFARRIAPCDIDDLVQDTLIAIHDKLGTYDPSRPFFPWLAAIARYRWVDRLRKVYRAGEEMLGEIASDRIEQDAIVAQLSIDTLFKLIPEAQATAIRLVKIKGLSISEASKETGQSEVLVKVNIHRGLKKLATLIEAGWV
jgi:RNA polymerase sigma factor (sigma-70 family)